MRVHGSLASDARSLDALKTGAARDPKGAVRQAASQFEALFMQMVLKSMRDAVPKSGMLEGAGDDVYRGMLDTQLAQSMSGRPGGLGDLIAKQLMRNMRIDDGAAPAAPKVSSTGLERAVAAMRADDRSVDPASADGALPGGQVAAAAAAAALARARAEAASRAPGRHDAAGGLPAPGRAPAPGAPDGASPAAGAGSRAQAAFVDRVWGAAQAAERTTGVPAGFIVGQAALESGWGRAEMKLPDGRSAHNLFGIKAGPGWKGPTVEATTTEWIDGRPVRTVERFRAYESHEASFADWARLMSTSPRYGAVVRAGGSIEGFAQGLQRAGYATDPDYASKLTRTITQALGLRRVTT